MQRDYLHRIVIKRLWDLDANIQALYGQSVPTTWVVHHQNGNTLDNRPSNLIVMPEYFNRPAVRQCPYSGKFISRAQQINIFKVPQELW
jgi:hypothetical protein